MMESSRFGKARKALFTALALAACPLGSLAHALSLEPFSETPGQYSLRLTYDPAQEAPAALRVRIYLKSSDPIASMVLRAGPLPVWWQVPPEMKREGAAVEVFAVAPNHADLDVAAPVEVFRLDVLQTGGLDTALIDSARIVEAYDSRARPLSPPLSIAAFTTALRAPRADPHGVALRRVDRLHEISFYLSKATSVRARVLDPRGKVVRALEDGRMPPGRHVVRWNGRDAAGGPVPAGAYYLELRLGPNTYHKTVSHAL